MTKNVEATEVEFALYIERLIDAPVAAIWKAWSDPEQIKKWFTPDPWKTIECEIELAPGGIFRTVMQGPDGTIMDEGAGCILDARENKRIVFTDALGPGYRPRAESFMTAVITLAEQGNKTLYRARVLHKNEEDMKKHEAMGFQEGWGKAIDQLETVAKTLA